MKHRASQFVTILALIELIQNSSTFGLVINVGESAANLIGSILDAKSWSLLANDAWLLGCIHAKTEFQFASPLRWRNLWDEGIERLTVTAREVIGITSHGYKLSRPNRKLEAVALCFDERKVLPHL
jgi:hypothetical protein